MGIYLNSGNNPFRSILNGKIYVDKTGLIDFVNGTINTPDRMTCFSRPRRFGKSFAAMMLCAYYSKGFDSREMFEGLEISKLDSFETYMNKLNVIYIDVTRTISIMRDVTRVVSNMESEIVAEIRTAYPDYVSGDEAILANALMSVTEATGEQFFFIIDEWDALFREAKNDDAVQKEYLQLLRGLFKGGVATLETIAGAYMTGILPIKKYGAQSALTDFREYTMVDPDVLTRFIGFTEGEVRGLCEKYDVDFESMKQWYDGYSFPDEPSVYNPRAVIGAVQSKRFKSYWTQSETYESLRNYISMNFDGLKDAIVKMLSGDHVRIDPGTFQNDMSSFESKDDVLTLLVHLGYLAYDEDSEKAYIPNLEITREFQRAVRGTSWKEIAKIIEQSESLLDATVDGNAEAVADYLDMAHESCSSIIEYNNEAALASAVTLAYLTAKKDYTIIRELPTGKGYADMVFIPHKNVDKPAMVVELKYDKSTDAAIKQIKERRYTGALSDYPGKMLLVGINYDKETKKHSCEIEEC